MNCGVERSFAQITHAEQQVSVAHFPVVLLLW
jgi:hypothetical protein